MIWQIRLLSDIRSWCLPLKQIRSQNFKNHINVFFTLGSQLIFFSMATRVNKIIFNKETREWLTSTHFWGPAMNWAIPLAAISDTQKDPKLISGKMTLALTLYSAVFMRFSIVVKPRNLLLFSCHVVNMGAQLTQGTRFINYHYLSSNNEESLQQT